MAAFWQSALRHDPALAEKVRRFQVSWATVNELVLAVDSPSTAAKDRKSKCWNSDCVVRFGSRCAEHRAGPCLTHVRGRSGKPCQPVTSISLSRRHFWHRCGCWLGPDHFFPAGAFLRPNVSQMLRTKV